MSGVMFWIVFPLALAVAVMLSLSLPREPIALLVVAVFWIGVASLAWNRWSKHSALWLGRVAAAIGLVIVGLTVYRWLPETDVFVVCKPKCPRTGSFWPLVVLWLIGGGLLAFTLWGDRLTPRPPLHRTTWRSAVWWPLMLVWTAACGYVLVNNFSTDVLRVSAITAFKFVGIIVLVVGGLVAVVMLLTFPSQLRRKRLAAEFARIGYAEKQSVLDLIDRHARESEFMLMYRPVDRPEGMERIGGDPIALPSEEWPTNPDGSPGIFLLQLPLLAPRMPAPWSDRILTVFLVDHALVARSYRILDSMQHLPNPASEEIVRRKDLKALAIPYAEPEVQKGDVEDTGGFDVARLVATIPGLREKLERLSKHPEQLMSQILSGNARTVQFSAEDAILVGGDAQLIQAPHDPDCGICRQRMRFLFQFSDVTDDFLFGDCGVGYVYGCDAHPERCEGFVDCF